MDQDAALRELSQHVHVSRPDSVVSSNTAVGELTVTTTVTDLLDLLTFLRDDPQTQFTQLIDLCAVDWPARLQRFDVVYHLLSMNKNLRIRVKIATDEETPVPSATGIFRAAGWFEREAWDLYGVTFEGHPNHKRILMWEGFEGHPLRKDYPINQRQPLTALLGEKA